MNRYRVRLKSGRVVGPFLREQVGELYLKGHIGGSESCQLFPSGEWKPLNDHSELTDLIASLITDPSTASSTTAKKEDTFVMDFSKAKVSKEPTEQDAPKAMPPVVSSAPIPKSPAVGKAPVNFPKEFRFDYRSSQEATQEEERVLAESQGKEIPKKKTFDTAPLDGRIDKTIVNLNTQKYLDELKKKNDKEEAQRKQASIKAVEQLSTGDLGGESDDSNALVSVDESTKVTSFEELKGTLESELRQAEEEMHAVEMGRRMTAEQEEEALALAVDDDTEEGGVSSSSSGTSSSASGKEKKKKRKALKPLVAISMVLLLGYLFLFDEEDPNKAGSLNPIAPPIVFPIEAPVLNQELSSKALAEGNALLIRGGYSNLIAASAKFRESLAHRFYDNPALPLLVDTYSRLLDDSTALRKDGNILFKLIQIIEPKLMSDVHAAVGAARFFLRFNKQGAAIRTLENFLRIEKNKPNLEFMALYLEALIDMSDLTKASKVFDKIKDSKQKPIELWSVLIHYMMIKNDLDAAMSMVDLGLKEHPHSVELILAKCDLNVRKNEIKSLSKPLAEVMKFQAEKSVRFSAKAYEYIGLLYAYQKKPVEAAKAFKAALAIKESPELRSMLASLDSSGDSAIGKLIEESKNVDLLRRAKVAEREDKISDALAMAVEAVDIAPKNVAGRLILAHLQIKQGLFQQAIKNLEEAQGHSQTDAAVNYALAMAYVDAYKFKDANQYLGILSSSTFKDSPEFAAVLGRMYVRMGIKQQAVKWLQEAINRDPLNDENYYLFADVLIKIKKYKEAQTLLTKAIALDPSNIQYRILYSKILYEQGTSVALGYLRDVLVDNPMNPQILGEIAINYYRSGQQKYFQETMKQLQDLPERSPAVFEYLIWAAQIDDRFEDLVKYAREYLKLRPGNLEIRMKLGEVLIGLKRLSEAKDEFEFVKTRLESYPKLSYYMSKIYLAEGNKDKAIELAKQEIAANPESEDGHILLGNIYSNLSQYLDAEREYSLAQQINPKSADVLIGLAGIKYSQNHVESAMDLYLNAAKLDPNNSFVHKQLGYVYQAVGQGSLAIESFKTYLEREPDAPDKKKIQEIIDQLK